MSKEAIIRVFEIVGGSLCVSSEDGQIIHDKIAHLIREGHKVVVSFDRVETLISAFLNAAIGQLYGEFTEEQIRSSLSVRDMAPEDMALLKRVVDNAKAYFKNRSSFDQAWKEEVGDEE
jgi:hypothetical protein